MQKNILTLILLITFIPGNIIAQYEVMFSDDYPPYNYINETGELVGFNIDILEAIKELYDSDITISGGKWKAINDALENGEIQAVGIHYPAGVDMSYIYTRSTINTSHCFLYNTNLFNRFSLETLRTTKEPLVALWKNDVLTHYVYSINPTANFLYVNSYEELINALDRKDVTCAFGQRIGSMYYAAKSGKDYVHPLEHRILERVMGFKISSNSQELADILNNGLEVILANGEYQRIYDKWIKEYNKSHNGWRDYLKYILIISFFVAIIFLMLIIINWYLQAKIRNKTKDLQQQLVLNSQIMKELEKQKNKAEESDKMKSAFLANMSHEIRTPMNGILGFTKLLKSADYSSDKQAKFIEIIQKSGKRMLETINNIIDISKLESGSEKLQIKDVNISSIITELLNFFNREAISKGIVLTLKDNGSNTSRNFYTDEYKLNSILTNLIKNAIKFTNEGSVEIAYSINEKVAEFWITDTGIGIPMEKQASIFDQFVQADFSYSSGFEGSGLGLSISKGYVELLNGKIRMKSEHNVGTTFYVRIPNDVSKINNSVVNVKSQESKQPIASKKYKIIIAEDDDISFEFLVHALKDISKNIIQAKDGYEVVNFAKSNSDTDIILMDIKMPMQNGFEATKEIRKFNRDVIIIAQTAYVQGSYKTKVKEAGCNSYISKPIDKQKLLEIIYDCMN